MIPTDTMIPPAEASGPAPGPRALDPDRRWFVLILVVLVEAAVAVDLIGTKFIYFDVADLGFYVDQADQSHWSREFWARFPLFPLAVDLLGTGKPLHLFQVGVSAAGAGWLAVELMLTVRNRYLGLAVGLWWLLIWRTGAIQFYQHLVLTEPLSHGLLMAIMAALLKQLRRPSERTRWLLLAMIVMWALARPSNFTVLGLAGLLLLLAGWLWGQGARPPGWRHVGLVMLAAGLVVPVMFTGLPPGTLYNIVPQWILPDEEALAWWEGQGMPVPDALGPGVWGLAYMDPDTVKGPLGEWNDWLVEHGHSTYVRWLWTHPGWAFDRYAAAYDTALTFVEQQERPELDEFIAAQGGRLAPARGLGNTIYPSSPTLLIAWICNVALLFMILRRLTSQQPRRRGPPAPVVLGFGMILTVPVLLFPVALGDAVELERHSLGLAIQLRAGLVLLTAWVIDELLAVVRVRSAGASA